jgi:hypothetical protein
MSSWPCLQIINERLKRISAGFPLPLAGEGL